VLDRVADEQVSRLREAMLAAADEDQQANAEKLPATSKLKLLPQVMEVLRKSALFWCFFFDKCDDGLIFTPF
jgi:transcription factor SPN1